jgi:di/tricarboxylate transporter
MEITVNDRIERGYLYWGLGPLPNRFEMCGTVSGQIGPRSISGALLMSEKGSWWVGNAGCIVSLPQREICAAWSKQVVGNVKIDSGNW